MSEKPSFLRKMFFPFMIFAFNREDAKNSLFNTIEGTKNFVKSADWRGKDIYSANMDLAEYYLNENKYFDANMRYRFASWFNKTAIEPLLGLAYVAISRKKYKKAKKLLQNALKKSTNESDTKEIEELINHLEIKK